GMLGKVSRLPGTAAEAKSISPKLAGYAGGEPIVYTAQYALEGVFKAIVQPKVLVMSTHGFFLEDQPGLDSETTGQQRGTTSESKSLENPLVRCGLLLTGCNSQVTGDSDDGVLTGLEIVGTDLRGTKLVVLSACQTGLGQIQDG